MIQIPTRKPSDVDVAIADAYKELKNFTPDDREYQITLKQIVKLNSMKKKRTPIDPNTLLIVLGNLAIGFAVINYEETGVVTTKVMSFLRKI